MRYLFWAAGLACVMTFISVFVEAAENENPAAHIAPPIQNRLPASNLEPVVISGANEGIRTSLAGYWQNSGA